MHERARDSRPGRIVKRAQGLRADVNHLRNPTCLDAQDNFLIMVWGKHLRDGLKVHLYHQGVHNAVATDKHHPDRDMHQGSTKLSQAAPR